MFEIAYVASMLLMLQHETDYVAILLHAVFMFFIWPRAKVRSKLTICQPCSEHISHKHALTYNNNDVLQTFFSHALLEKVY